jgi:hypothetical protein
LQLLPSLYIGVLFQLLEIAGFEVFVELPLNSLFAFCDLCCLMIVVAVADAVQPSLALAVAAADVR